jgi:hypothetical protein
MQAFGDRNLAGVWKPSYSAGMPRIWVLLPCLIILVFCGAVYVAYLAWGKMGGKKRIASLLLLAPHFLLIVCVVVSLLCGHPPQGSRCFNTQFVCAVLVVFILPLPALVGTLLALVILNRARRS